MLFQGFNRFPFFVDVDFIGIVDVDSKAIRNHASIKLDRFVAQLFHELDHFMTIAVGNGHDSADNNHESSFLLNDTFTGSVVVPRFLQTV